MVHSQAFRIITRQLHIERAPLSATCGRAGHLYGLRPGNRHQYLVMTMLNFIP
jgi:hypothetical protein